MQLVARRSPFGIQLYRVILSCKWTKCDKMHKHYQNFVSDSDSNNTCSPYNIGQYQWKFITRDKTSELIDILQHILYPKCNFAVNISLYYM